jgi:ParB-like chromosome segregation protein Spo0J
MGLKVEQIAVAKLIPYANNARTHSEGQVAAIAASVREFGFNNPVLIDGENGIIAGHGRVLAARLLGLEQVPCIRLIHLSDAQRRAFIIADNKLALNGGWDEDLLRLELGRLEDDGLALTLTGFEGDELRALRLQDEPPADGYDPDAETGDEEVGESGTHLVLGPYRLKVERQRFLDWEEEIRGAAGFAKEQVIDEMARRLRL